MKQSSQCGLQFSDLHFRSKAIIKPILNKFPTTKKMQLKLQCKWEYSAIEVAIEQTKCKWTGLSSFEPQPKSANCEIVCIQC